MYNFFLLGVGTLHPLIGSSSLWSLLHRLLREWMQSNVIYSERIWFPFLFYAQVSASVLRNLSWRATEAWKTCLRAVQAPSRLMRTALHVQKEATLKSVLSALWNLSAHSHENKLDICSVADSLQFLIEKLTYRSPSRTFAIVENASGILRNISTAVAKVEEHRWEIKHGRHLTSLDVTLWVP